LAGAICILAVGFFAAHGWLYYYGDAEAHLNIARRLFDTPAFGWEQLGSPWLPLPHVLIAPFAASDSLWRNGLAGSIPTAACFVTAALFLFAAVRESLGSSAAAWTAMLVLLLNPNALYLASTAMTEAVFAAALCGLLYFAVCFPRSQDVWHATGAGLCALAATWTRYEGWFLLPFCAVYFVIQGRPRWKAAVVFCSIAGAGPVLWIFYNWWLSGNPLDFLNGPSSAKAIQGSAPYPGLHDWALAQLYYRTCVELVLGKPLFWLAALGLIAAGARRKWWPVVLLALPPFFYVWSLHSGGTPIFVPELWPHSWYNTRYGLAALPLAAYSVAAITRTRWSPALVLIAIYPWVRYPSQENWITWKESEQNSISRLAWTRQAAAYLQPRIQPGEHIAAELDDTIGIFRSNGIPLKQVFHPADGLQWEAAVERPDLFLNTTWVVCQRRASSRLSNAMPHANRYILIHSIIVPDAPPLDIFHQQFKP
jgi:hypothetical protein